MEYKKLGRTGLWVSKLCLGTMNFGAGTDEYHRGDHRKMVQTGRWTP